MSTTSLAVGIGVGVAVGWILRGNTRRVLSFFMKPNSASFGKSESSLAVSDTGEFKMVLVVRTDLKMGKGKIAAQCAHAAVGAVDKLSQTDPGLLQTWKMFGQPKVVVKVEDEFLLLHLAQAAEAEGLNTRIISDAGRTQIPAGSKTVLAVGPGPANVIDKVTGQLKLL